MSAQHAENRPDPLERDESSVLTSGQLQLWLYQRSNPSGSAYNIGGEFENLPQFQWGEERLRAVLELVMRRHPSLRLSFSEERGCIRQSVRKEFSPDLTWREAQTKGEFDILARDFLKRPFALGRDLPIRMLRLYCRESGAEKIFWVVHHIVCDGVSLTRLSHEILTLINASDVNLAVLPPIQKKTFIQFCQESSLRKENAQAREYWQRVLKSPPDRIKLPSDKNIQSRLHTSSASAFCLGLSRISSTLISELSKQEGVTPFTVLVSAFLVLIRSISLQNDLIIGFPVSGRSLKDFRRLVGFFSNTLLIRFKSTGAESFVEIVRSIHLQIAAAREYEDFPFQEIMGIEGSPPTSSEFPITPVVFNLLPYHPSLEALVKPKLGHRQMGQDAKIDWNWVVSERKEGYFVECQYATSAYSSELIATVTSAYSVLLERMLRNPNQSYSDFSSPMLSTDETHKVIVEWNGANRPFPENKTVTELFEEQQRVNPSRIAVSCGALELTYTELNRQANRLGHFLRNIGVSAEVRVGVYLERSIQMVVAVLAIMKAGGVYIPLDPDYPPHRLSLIVEDSHPQFLVTTENMRAICDGCAVAPIFLDLRKAEIEAYSSQNLGRTSTPQSTAYITYTSGSSGLPKGVPAKIRSVVNYLTFVIETFKVSSRDKVLQIPSLSFDASARDIFSTLLGGGHLRLLSAMQAKLGNEIGREIVSEGITAILSVTPSFLEGIANSMPRRNRARLRLVLVSGEVLLDQHRNAVASAFQEVPEIINQYGPTECTMTTTFARIGLHSDITLGKPIPNSKVYILDQFQKPLPAGVIGNICIGGIGVAGGYINQSSLSKESFVEDPFCGGDCRMYKSGDLGRYLADGRIHYVGRRDSQVKIRGFRVEPQEIEGVLRECIDVVDCVVVPDYEATTGGNRLIAYVVPGGNKNWIQNASKYLRSRLPAYMIPGAFVTLEALPLNPNGKVDRSLLLASKPENSVRVANSPQSKSQERLFGIWAELLQNDQFDCEDNFFDIGGHSLLAMQMLTLVENEFRVKVDLQRFFLEGSIKSLEQDIQEKGAIEEEIPRISSLEFYRTSEAQKQVWLFQEVFPNSSAYHMAGSIPNSGELDWNPEKVRKILEILLARHSALRAVFEQVNGVPVQRIIDFVTPDLSIREVHSEEEFNKEFLEFVSVPFALSKGPLVRMLCLHQPVAGLKKIVWVIHHLVCDGISLSQLSREALILLRSNSPAATDLPPPAKITYTDFCEWQASSLEYQASEQYWRNLFYEPCERLILPYEFSSGGTSILAKSIYDRRAPDWLMPAIRGSSVAKGTTPFVILLSAFAILLQKLTQQNEFFIGIPVAGRARKEVKDVIGFFANVALVKCKIYPKSSFSEIVREMQDQVAGALKHQDYPFSRIVQEFGRDEGKFAFPLTPVLFNMLPHVESFDVLAKASLGHRAMGGDAKVDINWYIFRRGDDFHFECHYKRALFSSETIERFVHGYENLLAELLNFPYGEIRLISLFTREGAKSATSPGRQPLLSRDKVVSAQFESAAMRSPHSIAVEDDFREVSYATLNAWRCDVASKIAEKGVVRSGKVALLFDRNAGMIAAVLGVLSAGAAYVPLDPQYPVERLRFMLRDSGAHLLLCDPQSLAAARELIESPELFGVCEILSWHPRDADGCSNCETKIPDHDPDELAYLLYTSGSTGKPKGVAQTHRNLIHHVEQYIDVTQLRSSDTLAMSASYSFDASLLDIFGTLLVGGKLLILNLESIERYASLASRGGAITILHATPTTFRYLVDRAVVRTSWPQGTLRLCVLGGEPLTRREISLFNEIAPESAKLMSLMGSTEASIISVKYVDEASISMPVPLGRPVEATSVSLYRNDEEVIDCFVEGELVVYSEHVAKGYLNQDAEKDSMVFGIDPEGRRYYRTGDYGMYLPDGGIRPTGRRDRQFKIHGVRIDLGEIEFQLNSYPDVMDCCCLVRHIEAQDQELVAFTVRTADSVVDLQNLRRYLSRTLPSVMIPNRFIFIKALPKTPSGKIDRQKLLREDPEVDAAAAEQVSFITPTTASEVIVADIWSHILSVSNLSTTDSFFDLGGHSLLAMRTIAKISERMGVEVPLRTLFEFPRLGEFAAHVERSGKESKIVIPRLSRDSPMELSHAQKRIWFSHQYEQNKSAYNVSVSVDICGLFDPALIERAFLLLIERHESLRTIFLVRDGRPVQLVLRSVPFRLEVYDQLQSAPNHLRTEIIARLEREATEVQFDLEQGPLFRAKLILKERARGTLLFTIHHLITDGWSMGLLGSELVRAYSALFEEGSMLEPPQYGYVDYANWCNMALSGDSLKRGLSYWIEKLADAPPLLTLPTDRPRSSIRSGEGGFIHLRVPISPVRNLAARSDCTLFMVLAGAFNALVYRYSGQDDICIGTPVAGRSLSQFDDVIGLFANTVVLRSKVEGGKLFSEFLADFRDTCLDAYSYQEVPFELLVEALRPERSLSYSPIFQVMFSLQNAPREKMNIAGMELDFRRNARSFARHDLLCDIFEEGDELLLSFEYCADIFDRTTVERLAGHYVKLLDEVCLDSNIALDRIGLLSAVEKTELIHARRKLGAMILPPARCVHEVFVEHACATPGATALSFGGGTLTYGELNASVNKLARHLVKIGVEKNDLVGLYIRRTPEMIISLLAILKVGAAYLPLDANYPPERLTYMINDARPAAVVTTSALDTLIGIGCARMVLLDRDEALIDALSPDNFDTDSDGLRLAYVIYTSGSTGNPKGVAISHGALSNVLASIGDVAEIGSNDAWLAITSLSFDISALEIFLPLIRGGRVVLASEADGKDGHRLLELVRKNRVSVMQATPATWSLLKSAVEGDAAKSPALRVALCGGESWGPELLGFLTAWSSRVWNVYGPTETTIWSSANELRAGDAVVLGNPIANTGIYVLDSQMQLVPIGIVGEIYISGAGLSLGYVNQTELTAERFLKAPFSEEIIYKTGDLARYVQGGNIEYLARVDTQTKIRGFRIELGEIETLLSAMPQVARAIVAVREFAPGEKALIAYVVPSKLSDGSIEIEAIERALREKLPEYMIPSAFVAVDNFPLTLNGKIDRQALPAPDAASYLSGEGPLPKTEKEVLLSRAWCSVLGIERVSRGDNFFHLGGHSLLTVRLIVKEIGRAHV